MNSTCFESGDHEGITQQPPLVNWRNSGVGVGVIVGVGSGVFVAGAVGNAAIVAVAAESSVITGTGAFDVHAPNNANAITQYAIRILASSLILPPCPYPRSGGPHGASLPSPIPIRRPRQSKIVQQRPAEFRVRLIVGMLPAARIIKVALEAALKCADQGQ